MTAAEHLSTRDIEAATFLRGLDADWARASP